MTMRAIRVHVAGGPEVLTWSQLDVPQPGPGEVLVKLEAIGVNYVETYFRRGIYGSSLPLTPGAEGAGVVVDVGAGVEAFEPGDRVGSVSFSGSYAEFAVAPAGRLIRLRPCCQELSQMRSLAGREILAHAAAFGAIVFRL